MLIKVNSVCFFNLWIKPNKVVDSRLRYMRKINSQKKKKMKKKGMEVDGPWRKIVMDIQNW